jgi:glutamate/tyrosine decarboxylase-like PLP-dependent enzyme
MKKLSHCLNYDLFNNFNIRITVIVFGSLGSYYVYKKILHSFSSIGRNQLWKKIPFIQKKVENEIRKMKEKNNEDTESYNNKLVEKLLTSGVTNVDIGNINTIQESGLNKETLMTYLHTLKDMDTMPKLISGTIYDDHENQHKEIMQAAYNLYAYTNPMHIDLFHSVVFMEKNLIVMISKLLGNMEHQCGSITNGGTESIFLALKTYRDMKCAKGGGVNKNASVHKINVVAPDTVHCSVDKLCHYLNIQLIKIKSNHEHRVTVCDILNTINEYTSCVVLSAPSYGFGIMDDVEHIAPAMKERGIPVHVDACLGGFVWMFQQQRENGIEMEMEMEMDMASKYSFRVDGVTSVSACLHKYGYSQKGVSCILYRDESYLKYQYFVTADWDGGLYVSPTILGSRSGGLVAQAWVGFLSRGYKEYQDSSNKIIHIAKYAHEKIQLVRECRTYPLDLHIVCFDIGKDTYKLYDYLITKGFNLNALQNPPAIHLCVTKMHDETTIDAMVQEIETFIQCKDTLEYEEDLAPIYGMKASIPVYKNEILNECISSYLINKYST